MSVRDLNRFIDDLKLRDPLRSWACRNGAGPHGAKGGRRSKMLLEWAVAFAADGGFHFNEEEARAHLKAKAASQGETITNKYIDSLPAAGFFPFAFYHEIYLVRTEAKVLACGAARGSRGSLAVEKTQRIHPATMRG